MPREEALQQLLGMAADDVLHVTAAVSLTPDDQVVQATPPTSSTYIISMPPVCKCKGRIYTIVSVSNDTGTITVDDLGDALPGLGSGIVLTTTNDAVVLYSNGIGWFVIHEIST